MKMRDGRWRAWVKAQLAGDYAQLWQRLDALIVLAAPDFAIVETLARRARAHAAPTRRAARDVAGRAAAVSDALRAPEPARAEHLPAIADIVVTLDEMRRVERITRRDRNR